VISLRVSYSGKASLATALMMVVFELVHVKLSAVIKYHNSRYTIPCDDVPPDKFSNFSRSNGVGLYPLTEIIDCHKQLLTLSNGLGERVEDVHSPQSKG